MKLNLNGVSWKTTTAGVLTILVAVFGFILKILHDGSFSAQDSSALIAAVIAGVGLLRARDNDKTSADVGADIESKYRQIEEVNK